MDTMMVFFEGCQYIFSHNPYPEVCWVNNYTCTGRKLILHPEEPEDDLTKPIRFLTHPPMAICVQPDGTAFGDLFPKNSQVPTNCLPVGLKKKSFKVSRTVLALLQLLAFLT